MIEPPAEARAAMLPALAAAAVCLDLQTDPCLGAVRLDAATQETISPFAASNNELLGPQCLHPPAQVVYNALHPHSRHCRGSLHATGRPFLCGLEMVTVQLSALQVDHTAAGMTGSTHALKQ